MLRKEPAEMLELPCRRIGTMPALLDSDLHDPGLSLMPLLRCP